MYRVAAPTLGMFAVPAAVPVAAKGAGLIGTAVTGLVSGIGKAIGGLFGGGQEPPCRYNLEQAVQIIDANYSNPKQAEKILRGCRKAPPVPDMMPRAWGIVNERRANPSAAAATMAQAAAAQSPAQTAIVGGGGGIDLGTVALVGAGVLAVTMLMGRRR